MDWAIRVQIPGKADCISNNAFTLGKYMHSMFISPVIGKQWDRLGSLALV